MPSPPRHVRFCDRVGDSITVFRIVDGGQSRVTISPTRRPHACPSPWYQNTRNTSRGVEIKWPTPFSSLRMRGGGPPRTAEAADVSRARGRASPYQATAFPDELAGANSTRAAIYGMVISVGPDIYLHVATVLEAFYIDAAGAL